MRPAELVLSNKSRRVCHLGLVSIEKVVSGGYRRRHMTPGRRRLLLDQTVFGKNFAALMQVAEERGASQRDVARDIGVGEDKISKWRKGKLPVPDTATLVRIAIRFSASVDTLLDRVNPDYAPARADTTHDPHAPENKSTELSTVTSPVPPNGVLDQGLHTKGGTHADLAVGGVGIGTADRLSQSQAAQDAEMREIGSIDRLFSLIEQLDQSAGSVRSVADALRAHLRPSAPRTKKPSRDAHGADVRHPKARRGNRR